MMRTVRLKHSPGTAVRNGLFRSALVVAVVMFVWRTGYVPGTNAVFTDSGSVSGGVMTAGIWIPSLSIAAVSPASPDGENGFYKTTPCVKLVSSGLTFGTAIIYYAFSDDGDLRHVGQKYEAGACVSIPEGNDTHFRAVAINDENDAWRSREVKKTFNVDTECPKVRLEKPHERDREPGRPRRFEIHASMSDKNADRYWVTFEKKNDRSHSDRREVNRSDSFSDEEVYDWGGDDRDGTYEIKIEARDRAGNTCSDDARDWEPEQDRPDDSDERGQFGHGNAAWSELLETDARFPIDDDAMVPVSGSENEALVNEGADTDIETTDVVGDMHPENSHGEGLATEGSGQSGASPSANKPNGL